MTRRAPRRPPTEHTLDEHRAELLKAITRITASWVAIYEHSHDWQKGYPSGHKATTAVTGDESTITMHEQDPGLSATVWCLQWQKAMTTVLWLADQSHELNPKQPKLEDARERESTLGVCEGCGRTVANTRADRLVSGFCARCYKDWQRKMGVLDRAEFIKQRRALYGADLVDMADIAATP